MMTATDPQRRATDQPSPHWICNTRLGRRVKATRVSVNRFYARWGATLAILTGAAVFIVAVVLGVVALQVRALNAQQARAAMQGEAQAKVACQRARQFSPYVGIFLAEHHVFPPHVYREYTATIPKHC